MEFVREPFAKRLVKGFLFYLGLFRGLAAFRRYDIVRVLELGTAIEALLWIVYLGRVVRILVKLA